MVSYSSSKNENSFNKETPSSISISRYNIRSRPSSRENELLHRTRAGGVDSSFSPKNTRKSSSSKNRSSIIDCISSINIGTRTNQSDDTDEDVNEQTKIALPANTSGTPIHISKFVFFIC
jgi:hypothetical protein